MEKSSYKVFTESVSGEKEKLLQKAANTYRNNIRNAPRDVNSMHVLGLIECQLGQLNSAMQWFEKAIAIKPDFVDVQFLHGLGLMEQSKYAEAIGAFRRAHALAPDHIDINYNLGCALYESRQYPEATAVYQHVLKLKPDHTEALNNLGNIMNDQGRYKEANIFYQRVIALNPNHVMAHNNVGVTLIALDALEAAEAYLRRAIEMQPDYAEAHNNLGNVYKMRGQFAESQACYEKAVELWPDYAEAINNIGNVRKDLGDMDAAILHYEKSLRLKENMDHRHNLSLALLGVGRFEEGLRLYEDRWLSKQMKAGFRNFSQPQWRGEEAAGKTILIHAEQGFGDTLQFCRYAPMVKARGLKVIMEVQAAVASLITSLHGVDQVIVQGQELPDFDLHCPMLSLPFAFGTTLETIPAPIPYLAAPDFAVKAWRENLPDANGAKRIGLVWAGNGLGKTVDFRATDRQRSIAPELLAPLIKVPRIQFYSLQKVGPAAPPEFGLIDFMAESKNFADTAALIANLDLVISVDTAVVHAAGAIGKPVWMLNRFNNCWRWLQTREDSPWYPKLRQFRQPTAGDWESVIVQVRAELEKSLSIGSFL